MSAAAAEGEEDDEVPAEPQAEPAVMTPESRRLHYLEIALVLGVGFFWPLVYSLMDWWAGASPSGGTAFSSVHRIGDAAIAISVLAYVLHWQGRGLRTIGLTFRRSDLLWAAPVWLCHELVRTAVYQNVHGFAAPGHVPVGYDGLLRWLTVIPGAAKEELIVRAFLMTEVAELSGSWALAVFLSVGFQTLYHTYQGVPSALIAAGSFFVSAAFYASTRRITPVILAHSVNNFLWLAGM